MKNKLLLLAISFVLVGCEQKPQPSDELVKWQVMECDGVFGFVNYGGKVEGGFPSYEQAEAASAINKKWSDDYDAKIKAAKKEWKPADKREARLTALEKQVERIDAELRRLRMGTANCTPSRNQWLTAQTNNAYTTNLTEILIFTNNSWRVIGR